MPKLSCKTFFIQPTIPHSKNRNVVVTKSMLFQLNVVHKVLLLQMLLTQETPQEHLHTLQLFIHAVLVTTTYSSWSEYDSPLKT